MIGLARSIHDLLDIAELIREAETGLRSLSEPWADTTSPAGRKVLTVFAAESERTLIAHPSAHRRRPRRRPGAGCALRQAAKADRRAGCSRPAPNRRGTAVRETARILNVHAATPYRALETAMPSDLPGVAEDPRMSRWEHRYLGQERFPDALSAMEIEHFFTLGEDEFASG